MPIRLTLLRFRLKWGMIETKDGYHETKDKRKICKNSGGAALSGSASALVLIGVFNK